MFGLGGELGACLRPVRERELTGSGGLLGPSDVRMLAAELALRPTKTLGQNFVIDPNSVRRIVRLAGVGAGDLVLEVGPGLGSLTLALLEVGATVIAIEVDSRLADRLPETVANKAQPDASNRMRVLTGDALHVTDLGAADTARLPGALVANLPYNVSVPVLLTLMARFASLERALVMVQLEVAERLAAPPGSRTYGVPSAKARWFGEVRLVGLVSRSVFWPVPNVDSGLVQIIRRDPPRDDVTGKEVFAVIDAAFSQRRKMLRSALAAWGGGADRTAEILAISGVDPTLRGEALDVGDFAAIAAAAARL